MKFLLLIFISSIFYTTTIAQKLYSGVWRAGTGGNYLWSGVNWTDFQVKWNELGPKNLRLTDIETYTAGGQRYFSGVWEPGTGGYSLTPLGLDWAAFSKFWSDNSKTLRLIDIETYTDDSKRYFIGVFEQGTGGHALTPLNLDWAAFNKFWADNSKTMRLIDIETYTSGGKRYFLGAFRQGTGGYSLSPYGMDYQAFSKYWADKAKQNLRLIDIESYEENNKRIFLGVWRQGSDAYAMVHGVDFESLNSNYAEYNSKGLRMIDLETMDSDCDNACLNQALMPDNPETNGRDGYDYSVTATKSHCEGLPGSCPTPAAGANVLYRWPNLQVGGDAYLRTSVVYNTSHKIFTLPFSVASADMSFLSWLYSAGSWHHANDYSRKDAKTFEIKAAAPGKVIHVGWDRWSGNTMVVSHNAGGRTDAYRTIYMHLRNGADNDCAQSWDEAITWGNKPEDIQKKDAYLQKLNSNGCPEKAGDRNPTDSYWGKNSEKIDQSLLNKSVSAGQKIAWAGRTGPGGSTAIHLHIFYAYRDPSDNRWYFFDPYGIYSYGSCYPSTVDGAINTPCARYPTAWKNGKPGYAQ